MHDSFHLVNKQQCGCLVSGRRMVHPFQFAACLMLQVFHSLSWTLKERSAMALEQLKTYVTELVQPEGTPHLRLASRNVDRFTFALETSLAAVVRYTMQPIQISDRTQHLRDTMRHLTCNQIRNAQLL